MNNFVEKYNELLINNSYNVNNTYIEDILKKSILTLDEKNKNAKYQNGTKSLLIAIEELSELQQRLTKYLRGYNSESDRFLLLEEYVDVQFILSFVKNVMNFSEEEINIARKIKSDRIANKLNSNTFI